MTVPVEFILLALLFTAVIWMDAKATLLVLRDTLSEPRQRLMQLALVWLLPVLGALVVFAVHRPAEKHPGTYRELPDPGDDFGYPRHGGRRSASDVDDD
jgi:hypothetical protein